MRSSLPHRLLSRSTIYCFRARPSQGGDGVRRKFFQPGTTPHRLPLCNKNCYTAERFALLIMSLGRGLQTQPPCTYISLHYPANAKSLVCMSLGTAAAASATSGSLSERNGDRRMRWPLALMMKPHPAPWRCQSAVIVFPLSLRRGIIALFTIPLQMEIFADDFGGRKLH